MSKLRAALAMLTAFSGKKKAIKDARDLSAGIIKSHRSPDLERRMIGLIDLWTECDLEAQKWLDPEDIDNGKSGPFDSCDLRIWLQIAERAQVPFVPARTIMSLHEDEIGSVSGNVDMSSEAVRAAKQTIFGFSHGREDRNDGPAFPSTEEREEDRPRIYGVTLDQFLAGKREESVSPWRDPETLIQQSFEAMDDLPEDWMVRSNISGGAILKTFAGAGVIGSADDTGRLGPDLEVGPGWVRNGNRRRIDLSDHRIVSTFAAGHKDTIHFIARPWIEAARRSAGEDPLRHGTPFAGKGSWPHEWRVFVTNGRVTGVSSYYGWVGEVSPENASNALRAADLAQRMVDTARERGLSLPCFMDIELSRMEGAKRSETLQAYLADNPREGVSCTLDFLEVKDEGLMFLEGGPPHTPVGGGHACSFAGHGVRREAGLFSSCEGVALRLMDGVSLGDSKTWFDRENRGEILTWDEARELAQSHNPQGYPAP